MSTIDLKLKSYDELIFEITTLNTNNYLLQQKVEQLENMRKEAIGFTNSHFKEMVADEEAQALLNILNKGE